MQAYSVSGAVGTVAAVLGGAMVWAGGAIVSIVGVQIQYGAGHVLFTGMSRDGAYRCLLIVRIDARVEL
jgi:hypothetical protein